jgi:serine phosphatase RsbU (regulator of sigma subunit)
MPEHKAIRSAIGDFFMFFQPKDIVSGDFLWSEFKDNYLYLGVADCTGHGVSGAMVSMLASEKLSEGLKYENSPGKILSYCNRSFNRTFRQKESQDETKDGMDIGLIRIKKEDCQFTFSGANRPLWIISPEGEFTDIKPSKMGIGGRVHDDFEYMEFTYQYKAGSSCYLFSDGYADQFSEGDKKMMTKRLRELLITNHRLPMEQQREILAAFFHQWKGNAEQTDDVLLLGIRL